MLFGKSFMTAYFPVANPSGKVVGVLYVGIPMAQFEAMLAHAIQTMAIAAGVRSAARAVAHHADRAPRHQAVELGHGLADRDRERQERRRDRLRGSSRRDRRDRAHGRGVQEQLAGASAPARASRQPRPPRLPSSAKRNCSASSTSSRPASAASSTRCMNSSGDFERVARQLTETARTTAELSGQSAERFGDRLRACPYRGVRLRRTVQLDFRDRPPGPGIQRDRRRGRQAGGRDRRSA